MFEKTKNIILDIHNLTCGYDSKPVIENINLQLYEFDLLAISGPNGCGKSTLLKAIYQLCLISGGSIIFKGTELIGKSSEQIKASGIAYFMQKNPIFPHLTVKENLELALNGWSPIIKKQKIDEIFYSFPHIHSWQKKSAGILSGGQRQQLALAMLLVQDADLWLLDEPTSGLDDDKTELFINTIKRQQEVKKITIIMVEHRPAVVDALATRSLNFK